MTSPLAVIGLTYRTTDVQDIDGTFLWIVRGLWDLPRVRGVDLVIPSASGRAPRNREKDTLTIILEGYVRGTGEGVDQAESEELQRIDFQANAEALRTLMDNTLDPGPLVATLTDLSTRTIDARGINILWDEVAPSFSRVNVELESIAPEWVAG
jgi:hypothetical protein